jgi:hypothetical protein
MALCSPTGGLDNTDRTGRDQPTHGAAGRLPSFRSDTGGAHVSGWDCHQCRACGSTGRAPAGRQPVALVWRLWGRLALPNAPPARSPGAVGTGVQRLPAADGPLADQAVAHRPTSRSRQRASWCDCPDKGNCRDGRSSGMAARVRVALYRADWCTGAPRLADRDRWRTAGGTPLGPGPRRSPLCTAAAGRSRRSAVRVGPPRVPD